MHLKSGLIRGTAFGGSGHIRGAAFGGGKGGYLNSVYCILFHNFSAFFQLNFIGVTVEAERNYIHFPSNKHLFTPVPVGEKVSPKQVYELYNGGARPVKFTFDLAPLELLQQVRKRPNQVCKLLNYDTKPVISL